MSFVVNISNIVGWVFSLLEKLFSLVSTFELVDSKTSYLRVVSSWISVLYVSSSVFLTSGVLGLTVSSWDVFGPKISALEVEYCEVRISKIFVFVAYFFEGVDPIISGLESVISLLEKSSLGLKTSPVWGWI